MISIQTLEYYFSYLITDFKLSIWYLDAGDIDSDLEQSVSLPPMDYTMDQSTDLPSMDQSTDFQSMDQSQDDQENSADKDEVWSYFYWFPIEL